MVWLIVCHFQFNRFEIFQGISHLKPHILFSCSDGLALWHGLSDITHIKTQGHFEFAQVEIFQSISLPKTTHFVL